MLDLPFEIILELLIKTAATNIYYIITNLFLALKKERFWQWLSTSDFRFMEETESFWELRFKWTHTASKWQNLWIQVWFQSS